MLERLLNLDVADHPTLENYGMHALAIRNNLEGQSIALDLEEISCWIVEEIDA